MPRPKFVLDANVLEFSRNPTYASRRPTKSSQAKDRTASGSLEVEDLGAGIRTRKLSFYGLTLADKTGLENWYETIADGAVNPFTYYDEDGVGMVVRLVSDELDIEQIGHQRYAVELELEVVG